MKKVLVIEDHRDMHELLVWQLERMGFMPLSGKTAMAGIQIAVAEKPDLTSSQWNRGDPNVTRKS
jgi:DNA-binding response OmpR family regulator